MSQSSFWSYLAVGSAALATSLGLAYAYQSYTDDQNRNKKIAKKKVKRAAPAASASKAASTPVPASAVTAKATSAGVAAGAKKKKRVTALQSSAGTAPQPVVTIVGSGAASSLYPSDSDLRALITASLTNMQTQYHCDSDVERRALHTLRRLIATHPTSLSAANSKPASAPVSGSVADPVRLYSVETRILAAQWLLLYHTFVSVQQNIELAAAAAAASAAAAGAGSGSGAGAIEPPIPHASVEALRRQNDSDLELAWRLLKLKRVSSSANASGADSGIGETKKSSAHALVVDVSRLDVATRLHAVKRMSRALDTLLTRHCGGLEASTDLKSSAAGAGAGAGASELKDPDLGVAFVAACQLGRWRVASRLGRALSRSALYEYHASAAEQPVVDYDVVHRLIAVDNAATASAAGYGLRTDVAAAELEFCTYAVRRLKIRVRRVQCSDARVVASITKEYAPDSGDEWKSIALDVRYPHRIHRLGSVLQMISLSSSPIPMAGTLTRDILTLHGYAEVSPQLTAVQQTEFYRLTRQQTAEAAVGAAAAAASSSSASKSASASIVYAGAYEFTHRPVGHNKSSSSPPPPTALGSSPRLGASNTPAPPPAPEAEDLKVFFDVNMELEVINSDDQP